MLTVHTVTYTIDVNRNSTIQNTRYEQLKCKQTPNVRLTWSLFRKNIIKLNNKRLLGTLLSKATMTRNHRILQRDLYFTDESNVMWPCSAPSSSMKLDGDWTKEGKSWLVPKIRSNQ